MKFLMWWQQLKFRLAIVVEVCLLAGTEVLCDDGCRSLLQRLVFGDRCKTFDDGFY